MVRSMKKTWKTGVSTNAYFKAFESAGLPPDYKPHSFREVLVRHAMTMT